MALVWGRQDPLTRPAIGERLGDTLGWRLQVIEDTGHLPHVEQPQGFVDALRSTVASSSDRSSEAKAGGPCLPAGQPHGLR